MVRPLGNANVYYGCSTYTLYALEMAICNVQAVFGETTLRSPTMPASERQERICPRCDGTGEVNDDPYDQYKLGENPIEEPCDCCGGTGIDPNPDSTELDDASD